MLEKVKFRKLMACHRYLIEQKLVNECFENARLLSFCAEYLASSPFDLCKRSDAVSLHARQGYYSLQDYAVAHWYSHLKFLSNRTSAGSGESQSFVCELQRATNSTTRFLEAYAAPTGEPENNDPYSSLMLITGRLPTKDKTRNSLLNIETRTSWIRQEIENLRNLEDEAKELLDDLYGPIRYKCPKPACSKFAEGFSTAQERRTHVNLHERPFLCNIEDCFGQACGFESCEALNQHMATFHAEPPATMQFPEHNRQTPSASKSLALEVMGGNVRGVRALLDDRADINKVEDGRHDYMTPLWLAACHNKYEVCELLIQRGANLGRPASFQPKLKKSTKVDSICPFTPLAKACVNGNIKIVDLILKAQKKATEFADADIRMAFMKAVMKGKLEAVQLLMNSYDFTQQEDIQDELSDPLLLACMRRHASVLDVLLRTGFEFRAGVDYIARCLPPSAYSGPNEWRKSEPTLKIILASCKVTISSPRKINMAIEGRHHSIALLILSNPKTNLRAHDLRKVKRYAGEQSYTDITKIADTLLDAIVEVSTLQLAPKER